MAVLRQCFCYTLRQGSFLVGTYALIVYCVAFAVELWWIVESLLILPAPAYTLCALYFFNFLMAAVLLFGLLVKQRRYLMSWTLMTVLSFFPEAGMVLFMSLYYWPGHKYEYGVVELSFWSIRAMFNIFGSVCVCSLYLTWRDAELILRRLHDLTLASVDLESAGHGDMSNLGSYFHPHYPHHHDPIMMQKKGNLHNPFIDYPYNNRTLGYNNLAYLDTLSSMHNPKNPLISGSRCNLTPATVSNANNLRASLLRMKSEFNPFEMNNHNHQASVRHHHHHHHQSARMSECGLGYEPHPPTSTLQRSRSLWSMGQPGGGEEYWAHSRAPLSRPVSLGYINYAHQMEANSSLGTLRYQQHHDDGMGHWVPTSRPDVAPLLPPQSRLSMSNLHTSGTTWMRAPSHQQQPQPQPMSGWEELRLLKEQRRAQSMDGIHMKTLYGTNNNSNNLFQQRYGVNLEEYHQHHTQHHPHNTLQKHWSKSSVEDEEDNEEGGQGQEGDEGTGYQDIPL